MNTTSGERYTSVVLYTLILQTICLLFITAFCITVMVYGYPVVDGGAEKWKVGIIREVKALVEDQVGNWKSDIIQDVKALVEEQVESWKGDMANEAKELTTKLEEGITQRLREELSKYDTLLELDVTQLNQVVTKLNRVFSF